MKTSSFGAEVPKNDDSDIISLTTKTQFPLIFRAHRRKLGLSRVKFGELLGCSEDTVKNYEEAYSYPKIYDFFRIADRLGEVFFNQVIESAGFTGAFATEDNSHSEKTIPLAINQFELLFNQSILDNGRIDHGEWHGGLKDQVKEVVAKLNSFEKAMNSKHKL